MTATATTAAGGAGGTTVQPGLKKGALGLWDDTVIAVSSTAPEYHFILPVTWRDRIATASLSSVPSAVAS